MLHGAGARTLGRLCHGVTAGGIPGISFRAISSSAFESSPKIGQVIAIRHQPERSRNDRKVSESKSQFPALYRKADAQLENHLLRPSSSLVLLAGSRGVGKSTTLQRAVGTAREHGYVVLYIPHANDWTHGGGFFCATRVENADPLHDGLKAVRFYDRPLQMQRLFEDMLRVHAKQLEQIPCVSKHSFHNVRQVVERGLHVLEHIDDDWRSAPRKAADMLHSMVRDLSASDTPFLIAIDSYESFAGLTAMRNDRAQVLHANGIRCVAQMFGRDAIQDTASAIRNGFVILAQEGAHGYTTCRSSRVRGVVDFPLSEHIKRDPSGKFWLAQLWQQVTDAEQLENAASDTVCIDVPVMTHQEMGTVLRKCQHGSTSVDDTTLNRLIQLSGGHPGVLVDLYGRL